MPTILLVEDEATQRITVRRMLQAELMAEVLEASDGTEALSILKSDIGPGIDLGLIDLQMPVMDGISLLRQARNLYPKLPFIVLTGSERVEDAVEAMQMGAVDFITKPTQRERLITSIKNALSIRNLRDEVQRLQHDKAPYYSFSDIVTISPSLKEAVTLGRKAAASDIPILITGESGVGKEVFARAILQESNRSGQAFVPVNCGALPDNLVESTLFGHEKGSFTGATNRSLSKCREANGGILFLDEVGELKLDTQVKLLRLLQEGEIEPVGSGKPLKVDVRIISATNRSLEQLVAQGRFREDLYYRLQGFPVHIPSLRERRSDIPVLSQYLLGRIALTEGRMDMQLSPDAKSWLSSYSWPGNIRELQHVLHRAVLLTEGNVIEAADVLRWAQPRGISSPATRTPFPSAITFEKPDGHWKTLEEIEVEIFEAAVSHHGAHIGKAAAALGVGQSTLYKRMRKGAS